MSRFRAPRTRAFVVALSLVVYPALAQAATIGLNFTGVVLADGSVLNGGGYAPPDGAGAVGPDRVVQLINGAFAVYDKSTGAELSTISGKQFWINAGVDPGTGPGSTNLGAFNQRILYDTAAGRWIAAALSGQSEDNFVLVARSETSDPTGPWKAVSFLGNAGGPGKFADYTRLGVDANGVYISTNNYTSLTGGLDSLAIFSLPKADLMAATPTLANLTRFDGLNTGIEFYGNTLQPITNFGPVGSHAPFLGTGGNLTETVLYRTDLMNTAGAGAGISPDGIPIAVDPYTLPPNAAQPDGTRAINLQDNRFKSNVYQVGDVIYAAHDVKVGANAAIKWYKIDEATNEVIQEGVISDPNYDYFQASIAANAAGDVVIGFNRSGLGADGQISVYAIHGTTAGDVTTFGDLMLLKDGTVDDYHYINSRWGDYTTTVVDPLDPNVFWTFQEYALANNAWATNISQIIVPEPSSIVLAMMGLAFLAVVWHGHLSHGARRTRP
jgi:hypothetical protein